MLYSSIIILIIASVCQSLRCWTGPINGISSTMTIPAENICIRFFNCKTGWKNDQCTSNPSWSYGNWNAKSWYIAFNTVNNKDLVGCNTDYCNAPKMTLTSCYTGYDSPPQITELSSDITNCFSYQKLCTQLSESCSGNDITYKVKKSYYGVTSDKSCSNLSLDPSNINLKCCKGNMCNNDGVKSNGSRYLLCYTLMLFFLLLHCCIV